MLDRLFNVLLIREGERHAAVYFLCVFMLIGWGTAIGRGTADALFLKRFGIEFLPVMYTLLSPLLALCSIAYASMADRFAAERLFLKLFQALGLLLLFCWLLMQVSDTQLVYPVYFLVYEIASEMLLIHAALYLVQNFDAQQAKRLTSPIMAGAQLGTIIGGLTLLQFSQSLGVQNLLLAWFGSIVAVAVLLALWHRKQGVSPYFRPGIKRRSGWHEVHSEVAQGVKLLHKSPLLRVASLALFFMVIAFYVLSYTVHRIYNEHFLTEASLSSFYGILVASTSACALALQLLLTSRMIRKYGVRTVNLYFPGTLVLVFGGLMLSMSLPLALLASFSKDTIMPAFRGPVRNLFFNALPANIQGRARATSLIVVMPLALLLAGAFLWAVQHIDSPLLILLIGLAAALAYFHNNVRMNRVYLSEIIATLKNRLYLPPEYSDNAALGPKDARTLGQLKSAINHPDETVSLAFADALIGLSPQVGIPVVLERLPDMSVKAQDQLINTIARLEPEAMADYLWQLHRHADAHLQATALGCLCKLRDERVTALLPGLLASDNPRLRAVAVRGIVETQMTDAYVEAGRVFLGLLEARLPAANMAALELADLSMDWVPEEIPLRAAFSTTIRRMIASDDRRANIQAHRALHFQMEEDPGNLLDWLSGALASHDQKLRLSAVQCIAELANPWSAELLYRALDDSHPQVREVAVQALFNDDLQAAIEFLGNDRTLSPQRRSTVLAYVIEASPCYPGLGALAEHWADKAHEMARLKAALHSALADLPTGDLVLAILAERERDFLDLALEAVSPVEGREEVAVIRAALASGDRYHIASAREVLQNLRSQVLAQRLDGLLARETRADHLNVESSWRQLEELAKVSDEWFGLCVKRVSREVSLV